MVAEQQHEWQPWLQQRRQKLACAACCRISFSAASCSRLRCISSSSPRFRSRSCCALKGCRTCRQGSGSAGVARVGWRRAVVAGAAGPRTACTAAPSGKTSKQWHTPQNITSRTTVLATPAEGTQHKLVLQQATHQGVVGHALRAALPSHQQLPRHAVVAGLQILNAALGGSRELQAGRAGQGRDATDHDRWASGVPRVSGQVWDGRGSALNRQRPACDNATKPSITRLERGSLLQHTAHQNPEPAATCHHPPRNDQQWR